MEYTYDQYADDVMSGDIVTCKWVKQAVKRDLHDQETGHERGIWFDIKAAQHIIDFFQFCKHSKGKWAGTVIDLEPWQQWILSRIFGWKKADGNRRFRTVYEEVARKNAKSTLVAGIGNYLTGFDNEHGAEVFCAAALSLDTKLPTPDGWSTVGELNIGDKLFDENGNICNVTYMTQVMTDHKCYVVKFDDGSEIISDAGHLWETELFKTFDGNSKSTKMPKLRCEDGRKAVFSLHNKKHYVCKWTHPDRDKLFREKLARLLCENPLRTKRDDIIVGVRTTEEIKNTLYCHGKPNHKIKICKPIQTPEVDLPIKPYTLGAWLGDGRSNRGAIGIDIKDCEIIDHIRNDGYEISTMKDKKDSMVMFTVCDIRKYLREFDLIDNKHIPIKYLRSSISQRLQLLKGLMDTDGTCTKTGECRITSSIPSLASGIYELILSLGFKAHIRKNKTPRKDSYCISFKAYADRPVFNLTRKRERQIRHNNINKKTTRRYITEIKEINPIPVKCIEVDSESHLFLASEKFIATHNTKADQARIIHESATSMVKASPSLRRVLDTRRYNIHALSTGSKFEPKGKDSKTEDGLNVHGALIDEYHAHPDSGMYDVMRSGMGSRTQPLMYVITTAGFEKQCPCFEMREDMCNILNNYDDETIADDSVFAIIFTIDDDDDWMDESCWIKANPNLDISVDREDMRDMLKTAMRVPSKQNEFKTKKLNIWTESESVWISSEVWGECNHPVDETGLMGRTCYGGLDLSTVHDITAWTLCFPPQSSGDKFKFLYRFFIPNDNLHERVVRDKVPYDVWINHGFVNSTPGASIDYEYILDQIRRDSEMYNIAQIAYDPWNAAQIVKILENENYTMVKFGQGMGGMSAASKDFEKRCLDGNIAHAGNPVMKWMVGCTSIHQDSAGNIKPIKPDRGKSGKRIDGVISSIMSLDATIRNQKKKSIYETRGVIVIDN